MGGKLCDRKSGTYRSSKIQLRDGNRQNALPYVLASSLRPVSLESKSTAVGVCRLPKISISAGFFRIRRFRPFFYPRIWWKKPKNGRFLQKDIWQKILANLRRKSFLSYHIWVRNVQRTENWQQNTKILEHSRKKRHFLIIVRDFFPRFFSRMTKKPVVI